LNYLLGVADLSLTVGILFIGKFLSSTLFNHLLPRSKKGLPTENLEQMGKVGAAYLKALYKVAQQAN
jgi:hypothetical protein